MQFRTASYHKFISIFLAKQFHDSYTCRSAYFLQIWITPCWRISLAKRETRFSASAFRANLYEYCTINFSFIYINIYITCIHDMYIYMYICIYFLHAVTHHREMSPWNMWSFSLCSCINWQREKITYISFPKIPYCTIP